MTEAEETRARCRDNVGEATNWPERMLAGHEADAWDLPFCEEWSFPVRGAPS